MSMVTRDDVAAFEDVLAVLDLGDEALRDLTDRLRRKEDDGRVDALRRATDKLAGVRRQVQEQLR